MTPFKFGRHPQTPAILTEMLIAGKLSKKEFALWQIVNSFPTCFASNLYLAQALEMSTSGARHAVMSLVKKGLLKVRYGGSKHYGGVSRKRILTSTLPYESEVGRCKTPEVGRAPTTNNNHTVLSINNSDDTAPLCSPEFCEEDTNVSMTNGHTTNGHTNGFFHQYNQKVGQSQHIPRDFNRANRLLNSLKKNGLLTGRPIKILGWAEQFALLRTTDKVDEDQIDDVLMWYLSQARKGNTRFRQAFSAKAFRLKFADIRQDMERALKRNPTIPITKEAEEIADHVSRKGWPKGSKEQLPLVAQISLNNYRAFLKALEKVQDSLPKKEVVEDVPDDEEDDSGGYTKGKVIKKSSQLGEFIDYLLDGGAPQSKHMVTTWLLRVHERVANWQTWSGELVPFALTWEEKGFQAIGAGWSQKFAGSQKLWESLTESLRGLDHL